MKDVFLHMGLHKTGTTSFQNFLLERKCLLHSKKIDFYDGAYIPENHVELALSVLRENLDAPIKTKIAFPPREDLFEETRMRIDACIRDSTCDKVVFSNETLSFIRHDFEIFRLRRLFPPDCRLIPVVCQRNKADWMASFKSQMARMGVEENNRPDSCGFFAPSGWLLDHERLINLLKANFEEVLLLDYRENVIGHLLAAMGIEVPDFPERYDNVSPR